MKPVAIIDYSTGNIDSVFRAVEECGGNPIVTRDEKEIAKSNYIILPGVGSFNDAMSKLHDHSLDKIIKEQVLEKHIPFLGICLGMQLMATKGTEGGDTDGLGLIDGTVREFEPNSSSIRIPHVGWNEVCYNHRDNWIFNNIPNNKDFYFVHSYYFDVLNDNEILAKTPYCGNFPSVIGKDLIWGAQFHPEKSQVVGFQFLRNFLSI